ncbi:MAG: polymer-forming cytoskeletal protein [Bacillota bacterium]
MFGRKEGKAVANPEKVETIVGKDAELRGTIISSSGVRIDGKVNGEIESSGDLVIGQGATVEASVKARHVTVAGTLRGNVTAEGKLEITQTGKLFGDVKVGALVVIEGATFQGTSSMVRESPAEKKKD